MSCSEFGVFCALPLGWVADGGAQGQHAGDSQGVLHVGVALRGRRGRGGVADPLHAGQDRREAEAASCRVPAALQTGRALLA